MEERRARIATDGVRLTYWLSRAGPPSDRVMLLLHGGNSNHTRWSELVETSRLAANWNVLRPDLRGNGESPTREPHGLGDWCSDLVEILDAERFAAALVVGHSLGAQIGLHLAHRFPSRVCGLVLIDPLFPDALLGKHRFYARHAWLLRAALAAVRAANRAGLYRRRIPNRDLRRLDEETREALAGDESHEVIARRYGALGPVLRHMPTSNFLRQMLATVGPLPPLEAIGMPVLVLMSGGITFADLAVSRREVARLPDHDLVMLAANHWPLTETPEAVRAAIDEWVSSRFTA